jgi:putative N-acetylmannosamine-6-phosphate epimerase
MAQEKGNFILQQTAQRVDESILMNMENLIELVVSDERVIAVDSTINSFVEYDNSTFVSSTSKTQQSLMAFLKVFQKPIQLLN